MITKNEKRIGWLCLAIFDGDGQAAPIAIPASAGAEFYKAAITP